MLIVEWPGEDREWRDRIPMEWFAEIGQTERRSHRVIGPSRRSFEARCDVEVFATKATLDYLKYREANEKVGVVIGTMKITFTNSERTDVEKLLWREKSGKRFGSYATFYIE